MKLILKQDRVISKTQSELVRSDVFFVPLRKLRYTECEKALRNSLTGSK